MIEKRVMIISIVKNIVNIGVSSVAFGINPITKIWKTDSEIKTDRDNDNLSPESAGK